MTTQAFAQVVLVCIALVVLAFAAADWRLLSKYVRIALVVAIALLVIPGLVSLWIAGVFG